MFIRLLTLVTIIVFSINLNAEVFKFVDKEGKTHYVTNKKSIPKEYLKQTEKSLDLPEIGKTSKVDWEKKIDTTKPKKIKKHNVTVYVTPGCQYCKQLERLLTKNKVKYTRYDVSIDFLGQKKFAKLGGTGTPLMEVGDVVVRGYQPEKTMELLNLKWK